MVHVTDLDELTHKERETLVRAIRQKHFTECQGYTNRQILIAFRESQKSEDGYNAFLWELKQTRRLIL